MKEQIKEMYGDVRNAIVHNSAVDFSRGCILSVDFDGVTRELYDDGYRKQSEWISVKDRLPEDEIPVLVFTAKGTYYVGYYYKAVTSPSFTGFYGDSCRRDVTHWMPLPEPPKMKGGE